MFRRPGFPRARVRAVGLAACATAVAACASDRDERLDQLDAARSVWTASALAEYAYTYDRVCFCPPIRVRVSVADGLVVQVFDLEAEEPVPPERHAEYPTVDALFVELEELIRRDPYYLEVEYDASLGFPARVSVDIDERIADEEFGYTVIDLTEPGSP